MASKVDCTHGTSCGGCPLLDLPYDAQLGRKRGAVVSATARYGALELVYTEPVSAADPVVEYRTRAKWIVGKGGTLGLFARGDAQKVVDIPECRVLAPALQEVAAVLRTHLVRDEEAGGPLASFEGGRGALRAVDLREVRNGDEAPRVLLTFVAAKERAPRIPELREAAEALIVACPSIAGIALSGHDGASAHVVGNEPTLLAGAAEVTDEIGRSVQIATFGAFVQAHREQTRKIHDVLIAQIARLRAETNAPPRVLDVYDGSGSIGLTLARASAEVTSIEASPRAAERTRRMAELGELPLRVIGDDAITAVAKLAHAKAAFDLVVLTPPRRGTNARLREHVARLAPRSIAYVSCNPETLARDLDHFARLGYATRGLQPFDMIPLTEEVETLALLSRATPPRPRALLERPLLLAIEKDPHETTAALTLRAESAFGQALTALTGLDPSASGLVLFGRGATVSPVLTSALASARSVYVTCVRGAPPVKGTFLPRTSRGHESESRLRYRRLALAAGHAVMRVVPDGNDESAIARGFAAMGHPILGDERNGHLPTNRYFEEKYGLDRTFLHLVRIELDLAGEKIMVESPLAPDLRALLEHAGGETTIKALDRKSALGSGSSLPPDPEG